MEIDIAAALLSGILLFFQLTTSRGDRHVLSAIASSEHFFQLTTSRGDRQGIIGMNVKPLNFSTHDLSWRSTTVNIHCRAAEFFQLTTSRGGRPMAQQINKSA